MFSLGGGIGGPSVFLDPTKEREPPSPATPLDFPDYHPPDHSSPSITGSSSIDLYELLARLKQPQDVSEDIVRALNLKVEADVKLSEIVPGNRLSSLPPYKWPAKSPATPELSEQTQKPHPTLLSNGYPPPPQDKYDLLRHEVMFENDDAFRALARAEPRPGKPKIRLTHSRNFWSGLENVSQYWDSSLDHYVDKPGEEESPLPQEEEKDPDKMDVDTSSPVNDGSKPSNRFTNVHPPWKDLIGPPIEKSNQVYTGRRIGTGSSMPEGMREDTVRGFLEMVAWSHGCQIRIPSLPPRLFVKNLLFPVRHSFVVCRSPRDRREARGGTLEGPLLVIQSRGETAFSAKGDGGTNNSRYADICDLLRETVGMLLLAQERAREGLTETRPGEGKWWATEPRWGGAPNEGPVVEGDDNGKHEKAPSGETTELDRMAKRARPSRRTALPRKLTMAEKWKLVQPGPSLWDKKMRYMKIGKDENSPFDDIFMVSSINHHFSVLHLRVHPNYLRWLDTGDIQLPNDSYGNSDESWRTLILRRTRWFDFLNPDDRAEGLDGLWALFSWLMR